MYNRRITEVYQNVKFLSSRVTLFMTNNFSPNQFLREKRLSNAQGRGLCKANAGHAPREIVSWGRGIVGDAAQSWCDRPDDRFWSVSYIRRRYTKPLFTVFPLQLYGYPTFTADLYLHAFLGERERERERIYSVLFTLYSHSYWHNLPLYYLLVVCTVCIYLYSDTV